MAATLLGLLFVAISLNADLILAGDRPQTKLRAEQAFQNYIGRFLSRSSSFSSDGRARLLPSTTEAAVMVGFAAYRLAKSTRIPEAGFSVTHHWRRLLPSLIACGVMIYGGYLITIGSDRRGLTLVGIGTILLMVSATVTSWELLIRVAEIRHAERK